MDESDGQIVIVIGSDSDTSITFPSESVTSMVNDGATELKPSVITGFIKIAVVP